MPSIQEMILIQVQDNRKAIGALHLKIDEKITTVQDRINDEVATCHSRMNPIETCQATQAEKLKSLCGRIRWLVWAVSAIGLTILGTVVGIAIGGAP